MADECRDLELGENESRKKNVLFEEGGARKVAKHDMRSLDETRRRPPARYEGL